MQSIQDILSFLADDISSIARITPIGRARLFGKKMGDQEDYLIELHDGDLAQFTDLFERNGYSVDELKTTEKERVVESKQLSVRVVHLGSVEANEHHRLVAYLESNPERKAKYEHALNTLHDLPPSEYYKKKEALIRAIDREADALGNPNAKEHPNRIQIAGSIGSGKTSLAKSITDSIEVKLLLEEYRSLFFWERAMKGEAKSNLFMVNEFLLRHTYQLIGENSYVADFCPDQDFACARNVCDTGELTFLEQAYHTLRSFYPMPSCIVYLDCDTSEQLERIRSRGREEESRIDAIMLDRYNSRIQEQILLSGNIVFWFSSETETKTLAKGVLSFQDSLTNVYPSTRFALPQMY